MRADRVHFVHLMGHALMSEMRNFPLIKEAMHEDYAKKARKAAVKFIENLKKNMEKKALVSEAETQAEPQSTPEKQY